MIKTEEANYQVINDKSAILQSINGPLHHFTVPSEVLSKGNKKYEIIGILFQQPFNYDKQSKFISFIDSSRIEKVPTSFITSCRSTFFLPQRIKRVEGDGISDSHRPIIISNKNNEFISVTDKKNIMNHYPLELLMQSTHHCRLIIRETVKFIGKYSFIKRLSIKLVVIPASVEVIDAFAFQGCLNLQRIEFIGRSKLRKIGYSGFEFATIEKIVFPSSLEEIDDMAFYSCVYLSSICFPGDSKLKKIGDYAFDFTNIKTVVFPSFIESIGDNIFQNCGNLKSVSFRSKAKLKNIGTNKFNSKQADRKRKKQKL